MFVDVVHVKSCNILKMNILPILDQVILDGQKLKFHIVLRV